MLYLTPSRNLSTLPKVLKKKVSCRGFVAKASEEKKGKKDNPKFTF